MCTILENDNNDNSDYDDNDMSIIVTHTTNFLTISSESHCHWPRGKTTDTLGIKSAGEGVRH